MVEVGFQLPAKEVKVKSNIPVCQTCNPNMLLRSGAHFDDFWGCRNYPKCKESVNIPKPKVKIKEFEPSQYQQDIYDFVENGSGHGVVYGVAGCGKTVTNVKSLELVPKTAKTKYAAFNKHIERDISSKAPDCIEVSTFHKWGLNNIRNMYPKVQIKKYKVHAIIDDLSPKIDDDLKSDTVKAVSLLKGNLL